MKAVEMYRGTLNEMFDKVVSEDVQTAELRTVSGSRQKGSRNVLRITNRKAAYAEMIEENMKNNGQLFSGYLRKSA